ncbi:GNAT family N-acetyltransferase [Bacillus sp. NPDC094106]|uniref:GNAT family N-acetyltransferase n=1 Tax=Bacillus sp. NPDC094106 TaxID=3363949 RepID=UPI0038071C3F
MMLERMQNIEEDSVVNVLTYAVGPQESSLQKAISFYAKNKNASLYKYQEHGCVGIELIGKNKARVCHIAVSPDSRNKGVASDMIKKMIHVHGLTYIEAETDCEAVEFYRKFGFMITSLGEKYQGVERFHCYWGQE